MDVASYIRILVMFQLSDLLGGTTAIKDIVCNPLALVGFLQFSGNADINKISFELCYNTKTDDLLDFIADNLNTDYIVEHVVSSVR